jgi:hypothetical protein
MTAYWIAIASRDHVLKAVEGGFCQVNHGKEAPLKKLNNGDRLVYYSPKARMRDGEPIQAFTATGEILDDVPYQVTATECFHPFRRRVRYLPAHEAPIRPLLPRLSFSRGNAAWGQVLRRGLFEIEPADYNVIAEAMAAEGP